MAFDIIEFVLRPEIFALVLVWSLLWKGLALWRAAMRKEKNWFVALLIVNTVGILEIAYLLTRKKLKSHKRLSKLLKRRY